jgi:hypothetical protein
MDTINITQLIHCLPMVVNKADSRLLQLLVLGTAIGTLNPSESFIRGNWVCRTFIVRLMVTISYADLIIVSWKPKHSNLGEFLVPLGAVSSGQSAWMALAFSCKFDEIFHIFLCN